MDITTATAAQIDEQLAELWAEEERLIDRREVCASTLCYAAGFERIQTRSGSYFRETWTEAVAATAPILAEHEGESDYKLFAGGMNLGQLRRSFAEVQSLTTDLEANAARQAPLAAEYDRRGGWTRFFIAQSNDGHIHGSTNCSTCNRGRSATRFGWATEFSGQDEAGIVALAGEHACTVCFPSAPCVGPVDPRFRTDKQIARDEREAKKAAKLAKKSA